MEVLTYYEDKIKKSPVLKKLNLKSQNYFLVTLHRAENVDIKERLSKFIKAFHLLYSEYKMPVICSLHPRTKSKLEKYSQNMESEGIKAIDPLGLFDFVNLEKNAFCVLSDSGTVQEECCIFKIPNVTIRDVTERPETIEAGSNMLTGCEPHSILNAVKTVTNQPYDWTPPYEYTVRNVSGTVVKIILGETLK